MENNKQQTAVDWLVEKMLTQDWYTYKSLEYIKKAKEMEKEQKEISYADGYKEGYNRAIELTQLAISNLIPPHNESNIRIQP